MSVLGPRASRAYYSEREAWDEVRDLAARALDHLTSANLSVRRKALQDIDTISGVMLAQLKEGHHENPPLLIWPNPPSRNDEVLSSRVLEIKYRHAEDGQDYRHKFSAGDSLVTMDRRGVKYLAIIRADGRPLWKDF